MLNATKSLGSISCCIMWFKALSWQRPFSSLTLSVKTGAESTEKKTRLWFTMKSKQVFVLALRNAIVTALDHLQWKVITLSSFKQTLFPQKKQACIKIHSAVSFEERHGFYVYRGMLVLWDFHARTSQRSYIQFQTSWFWIKYNIYTGWTNQPHRERDGCTSMKCHLSEECFSGHLECVFVSVCSTSKNKALYGRDISTNRVS